jgi:hypothetical protein
MSPSLYIITYERSMALPVRGRSGARIATQAGNLEGRSGGAKTRTDWIEPISWGRLDETRQGLAAWWGIESPIAVACPLRGNDLRGATGAVRQSGQPPVTVRQAQKELGRCRAQARRKCGLGRVNFWGFSAGFVYAPASFPTAPVRSACALELARNCSEPTRRRCRYLLPKVLRRPHAISSAAFEASVSAAGGETSHDWPP